MIAHVAEAGEARGRVVLQLSTANPSSVAIEAAVRVAQAFHSEIESLFVENRELLDLAAFPFAREISLTGRRSRTISLGDMEREFRWVFAALQRQIEAMARAAEVPVRQRTVRGEPIAAVAAACSEYGPWNVVALAEPLGPASNLALRQLFERVSDATGLVLVGTQAKWIQGPVVAAVEELERLPGVLRAADRLVTVTGGPVTVLLLADNPERLLWMEAQARLLLADRRDVRLAWAELAYGAPKEAAEVLRRLRPGFVISQFGGLVLPDDSDLKAVAAVIECPLFLVR
jgi:hypothetical protein